MSDNENATQFEDPGSDYNPFAYSHAPSFTIQLINTANLWAKLKSSNVASKIEYILRCMDDVGLNLPIFLDLVSWGDPDYIANVKIRYERTALMVSEELPSILRRWHKPPRTLGSICALREFSFECMVQAVEDELETVQDIMQCPEDALSADGLTNLFIENIILKLSIPGFGGTPTLWAFLHRVTQTVKQRENNTYKTPELVCG
ncbi:hypothetical protein K503DRAFT_849965 [Rhizopogon vinicolor AM-OR11-026]|uniref:Uncharacterized protein n=1 Tax=Rhizopogon vinicolor AM-OR11-026 TaxID=1314800 RepID=A0A1B7N122_9AGAM|nr:hypothetical protein K503DRAFT_849965 [Rhizopogon vinicolor AM-OR11-026]